MTKRMLVDATHPEETRVAIVEGNWLSDFDFERANKKQLKGNIYLAKVIRIEPSLQAAFVEYGGNRHGFLSFAEIHPDYYRIPMADRPHDEGAPEDDDQAGDFDAADETSEETEATLAAYRDEVEPHDHALAEDGAESDIGGETLADESEQAAALTLPAEPTPLSEFAQNPENDLGLITDFGNAAIGDAILPAAPIPLETVGGEVAEQAEERYRRPARPRYKIQEVIKRRQVMLIQVVKEERGNKGAALTTFLSLAGRYCVLMPNTDRGGGVSRKITSHQDRRRMKEMLDQLEVPDGMAVILRTAGMEQEPAEIQRDLEYLLRLWNGIREQTLQSNAPALIYEEANLIKRSLRDLYSPDLEEILVAGAHGYQLAQDFMQTIVPDQIHRVKQYTDPIPLFFRYKVENQIDQLYNPVVQLRSGGYIVINPTEALVSIDVNSGRATRERNIEGTALRTNLEAADEIARQLRLRDLAGLVVIDFIDMEDGRNNAAVERRMKEAMRGDRARLQIGRISPFGLLELSRQRLRPSLMEINFEKCTHCAGIGFVRSVDSAALSILRTIEEEGIRQGPADLVVHVPTRIALYILNQKRPALTEIEKRYGLQVLLHSDDALVPPDFRIERLRSNPEGRERSVTAEDILADTTPPQPPAMIERSDAPSSDHGNGEGENRQGYNGGGRRGGRGRFGRGRDRGDRGNDRGNDRGGDRNGDRQNTYPSRQPHASYPPQTLPGEELNGNLAEALPGENDENIGNVAAYEGGEGAPRNPGSADDQRRGGRRRGRRGGRGRRSGGGPGGGGGEPRAPRDPNFQQRPYEPRPRDWNRPAYENGAAVAAPAIPVSIHDIDTTPREPAAGIAESAPRAEPRTASSSVPYEVVEQASEKPKGGWWRRLTGQ